MGLFVYVATSAVVNVCVCSRSKLAGYGPLKHAATGCRATSSDLTQDTFPQRCHGHLFFAFGTSCSISPMMLLLHPWLFQLACFCVDAFILCMKLCTGGT